MELGVVESHTTHALTHVHTHTHSPLCFAPQLIIVSAIFGGCVSYASILLDVVPVVVKSLHPLPTPS